MVYSATAAAAKRICNVQFTDSYGDTSKWEYEIPAWVERIAEGDTVVCDYDGQLKLGTVLTVGAAADHSRHCLVVCRVPVEEHRANVAAQRERKELLAEMAARKEELDALAEYEKLKDDPLMAALLTSFSGDGCEDHAVLDVADALDD